MEHLLEELLAKIKSQNPNSDLDPVKKAFALAKAQHEGQFRLSGEPFFMHPVAVANILADILPNGVSASTQAHASARDRRAAKSF